MSEQSKEREHRRRLEVESEFKRLSAEAVDEGWWRKIVELVKERKQIFLEELAGGTMDQRHEDRLRGSISELNWLLALDYAGKNAKEEIENGK